MNQLSQREKDQFVSLELTYQKAAKYIKLNYRIDILSENQSQIYNTFILITTFTDSS